MNRATEASRTLTQNARRRAYLLTPLTLGVVAALSLPGTSPANSTTLQPATRASATSASQGDSARSTSTGARDGVNYLTNPRFSMGTHGWVRATNTAVSLSPTRGRDKTRAAVIKPRKGDKAVLYTTLVSSAMDVTAGDSFTAGAWVRSSRAQAVGLLRVFTQTDDRVVESRQTQLVLPDQGWHYLTTQLTAGSGATNVRVEVGGTGLEQGRLTVDNARLARAGDNTLIGATFNQLAGGRMSPTAFSKSLGGSPVGSTAFADTSVARDSRGYGRVMRTTLKAHTIASKPKGRNHGIVVLPSLGKKVDRACIAYDVRFDHGFDWSLGGKLPGLLGVAPGVSPAVPAGGNEAGDKGWSGRMMWLGPKAYSWAGPVNMAVSYMYSPRQSGRYGDNIQWHKRFVAGRWHTVKQCYVMNTVGRADGVLRAWIDGRQTVNVSTFTYRTRSDVAINYLAWSVFRGGSDLSWAGKHDDHIDFDNVLVTAR